MDLEDTSILTMINVDNSKIPPIHQKRILAFVNHFLISTCSFLNNFSAQCETRFLEIERKMQKVEAALTILESKLSSISGLEELMKINENAQKNNENVEESHMVEFSKNQTESSEEKLVETHCSSNGVIASEDKRYKKYFKMMQVGVPINAIKAKMKTEGFNPEILENPNQILEDGIKEDI